MDQVKRLQLWFESHCDGEWEHKFGVTIETLDNPGWTVQIDLAGTAQAQQLFEPKSINRSDGDWFFAKRTDTEFKIACGIHNLGEALKVFCDWADVREQ